MFPGKYKPTLGHFFIRLMEQKGLLLRNYTQNIDTLEREAGITSEKLVEAHGSFSDAHCIDCHKQHSLEHLKQSILNDESPRCSSCNGFVKPDIVFFGESLPERFFTLSKQDFRKCDLLIVAGTSLTVHPFASLINLVDEKCVRLLINREEVGKRPSPGSLEAMMAMFSGSSSRSGFLFDEPDNTRDAKWLGSIDDGVLELAKLLGWEEELKELANSYQSPML